MSENTPFQLPLIQDEEDKGSALKNRLRKNYRHLRKWANKARTNCFRIYDRDIKEYPLAIDYYDGRFCVHAFMGRGPTDSAQKWQKEVTDALCRLFGATEDKIYWKMRIKRTKMQQYEKISDAKNQFLVMEHGVYFFVNLQDYLDTGLFLDHRNARQIVAKACRGKRLLNLFAYTCSFSVQAAAHGASFTKSVDLSNTYTRLGRKNFSINGLSGKEHEVVRADCLKFLDEEIKKKERYDVIVIDPPTLSRSKKMDQIFDVQRDHVGLIEKALQLLNDQGVLYFSTNSRQFVWNVANPEWRVEEISRQTRPFDFRSPKIHRCWRILAQ